MSSSTVAQKLTVNVNNIDISKGGNIVVLLFTQSGFPKNHQQAIMSNTQVVSHERQQFTFKHQLEGFAVKVLHDENGDGKVTKNWTGIYPHDGLYPLSFKMLCSVASLDTKARRNMMTMASPYRMLQR